LIVLIKALIDNIIAVSHPCKWWNGYTIRFSYKRCLLHRKYQNIFL